MLKPNVNRGSVSTRSGGRVRINSGGNLGLLHSLVLNIVTSVSDDCISMNHRISLQSKC